MKTIRATVMTLCLATAFGLTSAGGPSSAQNPQVMTNNYSFSPNPVTIQQGQSITWVNNSGTPHTATGPGFDTGNIDSGSSKTAGPFNTAGQISYYCKYHQNPPLNMKGTINVQPAPTTPPPTTSTPPPPPTTSTPPPPPPGGSTTPKATPKATATQTQSGTSPQASPADAASPQESPTAEASLSPSTSPSITGSPARTPEAQGRSDSGLPPGLIGLVVIVLLGLSGGGVVWWMSRRGW